MEYFVQFAKLDGERRLIHGRAVLGLPDRPQEVLDYDAAKPAFREWSKAYEDASDGLSRGDVRAMRSTLVAGRLVDLAFSDAGRTIDIVVKVVGDNEWQKRTAKRSRRAGSHSSGGEPPSRSAASSSRSQEPPRQASWGRSPEQSIDGTATARRSAAICSAMRAHSQVIWPAMRIPMQTRCNTSVQVARVHWLAGWERCWPRRSDLEPGWVPVMC